MGKFSFMYQNIRKNWFFYFCLLVIVVPPVFAPIGAVYFYHPVHRMSSYLDVLVLLGAGLFFLSNSNIKLPASRTILFLYAIIGWSTLSLAWTINFGEGLMRLMPWAIGTIFMIMTYQAFDVREKIDLLLKVILWLTAVLALIGILQHLIGLDIIIQRIPPASTFGNRNLGAQFMLFGLPIAVYLFWKEPKTKHKLLFASLGITLISYVIMAKTRSTILGMAIQMAILIPWILIGVRYHLRKKFLKVSAVSVLCVLVSLLVAFYWYFSKQVESWGGELSFETINSRIPTWINSLQLIKENFFIGTGIGNWKVMFPKYSYAILDDIQIAVDLRMEQAHNEYIQLFSELGIVGFLLLLGVIVFFIVEGLNYLIRQKDEKLATQYVALVSCLIGVSVTAFFSFPWHMPVHILLTLVLLGIISQHHTDFFGRHFSLTVSPGIAKLITVALVLPLVVLTVWFHYSRIEGSDWMRLSVAQEGVSNELALRYARKAHDIFPWMYESELKIGMAQTNLGDVIRAERTLLSFLDRYPYSLSGLALLSQVYITEGDYGQSAIFYERMLEINPKSGIARKNLALLYLYELNRPEEGIQHLKELMKYEPTDDGLLQLAQNYEKRGNYAEARSVLDYLTETFPENESYQTALNELIANYF